MRIGVVGLLATASALVATPAGAHATAVAESPVQGGWSIVSVRVPTESETASTVRIEVAFPLDTPVPAVRTSPLPGWTATVRLEDLPEPVTNPHGGQYTQAVSRVVWEATDPAAAIGPGEYGEFTVQAGPLPAVGELVLPTIQTYDDGTESRWIDRSTDGTEAEHPAPSITLAAEVGTAGGAGAAGTAGAAGPADAAHHVSTGPDVLAGDELASVAGIAVVALVALAGALVALVAVALVWRRSEAGRTPSDGSSVPPDPDGAPDHDGLGGLDGDPATRPRSPRIAHRSIGLPPL
ncbi:YcnI family copper-binding membrane protein [Oerskovia jenensis]|uniref:YcnI family copper-binding membrane protein n=1 Tax=Oerskovia jenensis TaxID=162169 RepID=UPI0036DABBDD